MEREDGATKVSRKGEGRAQGPATKAICELDERKKKPKRVSEKSALLKDSVRIPHD